MYEQEQQRNNEGAEAVEVGDIHLATAENADVVDQKREPLHDPPREGGGSGNQPSNTASTTEQHDASTANEHGECCEECKKTCKRNFWTEVLRAVVKISTIVLAAFGITSFSAED